VRPDHLLPELVREVRKRIDRHRRVLLAEPLPGYIFLLALLAPASPLFLQGRRFLTQRPTLG
jgi:hypothetical protein